jgi:hypothetical protein
VNSRSRLRPLTDISPANWLVEEIGEFGAGVRGLLPFRFESYARVLHPVRPSSGAAKSGNKRGGQDSLFSWRHPPARLLAMVCSNIVRSAVALSVSPS